MTMQMGKRSDSEVSVEELKRQSEVIDLIRRGQKEIYTEVERTSLLVAENTKFTAGVEERLHEDMRNMGHMIAMKMEHVRLEIVDLMVLLKWSIFLTITTGFGLGVFIWVFTWHAK